MDKDEALMKVDGDIDMENLDHFKLSNMVLSVISERLEDVQEVQEFCLVIENATLFELLKTR